MLPTGAAAQSGKSGETPKAAEETKADAPVAPTAKQAVEAFNKGRVIEAVRIAKPLADADDPEALMIMALASESGRGVEASREMAIEYYRRAYKAENQEAAYRLARLLVSMGTEESRKEAQTLLEKLAKSDTGAASRILGEGALRGWFGGEADFEKARTWWAKGAENGDVTAMLALGRLLDGNFGFPDKRDPAASLKQFEKAAKLGNPAAMVAAGSRLLNGDEKIRDEKRGREWIAKGIGEGQFDAYLALGDFEEVIKKNEKAAYENYKKGADAGQSGCMLKTAQFLLEGRGGVEKDPQTALGWFRKAGQSGNPIGHVQAAAILLQGKDPANVVEGYAHLVAAAEADLADVQNELGLLYLSGRLGIRDATAAAGWFGRSAAKGYLKAANNLGALYEKGLGVPKDYNKAGRFYARAANAGLPEGATALGRLYAQALGTKQDLPKAWALFSIAVERGDTSGMTLLGELTSQLTEEQIAEGRKILADLKSGKKEEKMDENTGEETATETAPPTETPAPEKDAKKDS